MSTLQEFASGSTLFGGNVPYIEEQYERYLANPDDVSGEWRAYFDSLRGGASDVAHAPVIQSFIELGKHRKVAGAMVDASTMHKQVLVLRLISKFRTLGMFHADLDPLKRQERPLHRGPRPRDLRLHAGRPRDRLRRRLVPGRHRPDAARRSHRRARGDVLPDARRRIHVHLGHADQALPSGAAGAHSRAAHVHRRAAAAHPRAADRCGNARALPAYEIRRAKALFRRGRPHDDSDARSPDPARRRARRPGDGDRHGAPRAPQRARQHAGQDARGSVLGVRRQARAGVHRRRRQVSPGLFVGCRDARRPDAPDARVQSVAPRDRESRRRGLGARAPAPAGRHQGRRRCFRC